ncbi:Kif21b, partial [Symbiodinium sp. KB8]
VLVRATARSPHAMSITVQVGLLSGKTATVTAGFHEDVEALMRRAQTTLGAGRVQLLAALGSPFLVTDLSRSGVVLFTVVTAVHDKLSNVRQIQATQMTWGHVNHGGDSSAVQDQLKNVQQIQTSFSGFVGAFAVILGDGSLVTWGAAAGGDSSGVGDQLKHVQQIQASAGAFAAMLRDGSVVTWALLDMVVTVVLCRVSSRVCGRSKAILVVVSLPFLVTDPL